MTQPHLILGVTRRNDDPKGPVSGLIHREGDRLKFTALDALAKEGAPRFFRLTGAFGAPGMQLLERVELTVSGTPHFLFKQKDGKLGHESLAEKLQFSEGKKSLLKPQRLPAPLQLTALALEYLEVARLSDTIRQEMLGGERSIGQLAEVLGIAPADRPLDEALWELSRRSWLTVHESGVVAENAIGLNKPVPEFK